MSIQVTDTIKAKRWRSLTGMSTTQDSSLPAPSPSSLATSLFKKVDSQNLSVHFSDNDEFILTPQPEFVDETRGNVDNNTNVLKAINEKVTNKLSPPAEDTMEEEKVICEENATPVKMPPHISHPKLACEKKHCYSRGGSPVLEEDEEKEEEEEEKEEEEVEQHQQQQEPQEDQVSVDSGNCFQCPLSIEDDTDVCSINTYNDTLSEISTFYSPRFVLNQSPRSIPPSQTHSPRSVPTSPTMRRTRDFSSPLTPRKHIEPMKHIYEEENEPSQLLNTNLKETKSKSEGIIPRKAVGEYVPYLNLSTNQPHRNGVSSRNMDDITNEYLTSKRWSMAPNYSADSISSIRAYSPCHYAPPSHLGDSREIIKLHYKTASLKSTINDLNTRLRDYNTEINVTRSTGRKYNSHSEMSSSTRKSSYEPF